MKSNIEKRMDWLERQNRYLKIGLVAVMVVMGGAMLVGATQGVPDLIEAREFRVVDSDGGTIVFLGRKEHDNRVSNPSIIVYGETTDATMEASAGFASFNISEHGSSSTAANLTKYEYMDEAMLFLGGINSDAYYSGKGFNVTSGSSGPRAILDVTDKSVSFSLSDVADINLVTLGNVNLTNYRGDSISTPVGSLILFDKKGNVTERLPK